MLPAKLAQRIHEAESLRQPGKGGRFTTRYDQSVQPIQLTGQPHLDNLDAQRFEHDLVFCKVTL